MKTEEKTLEQTAWLLWICDNWRRWTTVKHPVFGDSELDGKTCQFSGCNERHVARIVGETNNPEFASKWPRGWRTHRPNDQITF